MIYPLHLLLPDILLHQLRITIFIFYRNLSTLSANYDCFWFYCISSLYRNTCRTCRKCIDNRTVFILYISNCSFFYFVSNVRCFSKSTRNFYFNLCNSSLTACCSSIFSCCFNCQLLFFFIIVPC